MFVLVRLNVFATGPSPEHIGDGHSTGTAAEWGSYRPDGSRDGRWRAGGQEAVPVMILGYTLCDCISRRA